MSIIDALVAELDQEAGSTRRLLERLPADRLDFKPHERSMPLGRLAGHVAEIPGWGPSVLEARELDFEDPDRDYEPFVPDGPEAAVAKLDESVAAFRASAAGLGDDALMVPWTMRSGDTVHLEMPRVSAVRGFLFNHFIHHRGQLTVYLRLLDVRLPSVYGPTADENPFG